MPLVVDRFKEEKCLQKQSKYLHSWLCIVAARLTYREAQRDRDGQSCPINAREVKTIHCGTLVGNGWHPAPS